MDVAKREGRPFQYLQEKVKKDELARQIAERDRIEDGLICVLSVLEPCRTFSFRTEKGKPFVASARRKCLFLCYYFMDRDFSLIHVKLQTWFPLQIQVYVNGHEWLARKLKETESGIGNWITRSSGSRTWPEPRRSQTALPRWSGPGY